MLGFQQFCGSFYFWKICFSGESLAQLAHPVVTALHCLMTLIRSLLRIGSLVLISCQAARLLMFPFKHLPINITNTKLPIKKGGNYK